ncbi:HAD hydrolase-like protein [Microbacterium aurum]
MLAGARAPRRRHREAHDVAADAGRGRPAPDLVWTAALRTGAHAASRIAVVGDTASDVESGLRAGAGLVVGVLSGAHDRAALEAAGAHVVIDDVTALPGVLAAFSGQAASAALPAVR